MICVEITDDMKDYARKVQDNTIATLKKQGRLKKKSYTGLEREDRYYIGCLGELCFVKHLKDNDKAYDYAPRTDGVSDSGDVTVKVNAATANIDVKTASRPYYEELMMPKSQHDRQAYSAYVGVRLNGDKGEIHGWCKQGELKESDRDLEIPTMAKRLDQLRDISTMLKQMDEA